MVNRPKHHHCGGVCVAHSRACACEGARAHTSGWTTTSPSAPHTHTRTQWCSGGAARRRQRNTRHADECDHGEPREPSLSPTTARTPTHTAMGRRAPRGAPPTHRARQGHMLSLSLAAIRVAAALPAERRHIRRALSRAWRATLHPHAGGWGLAGRRKALPNEGRPALPRFDLSAV